jgi:hypothetical protein
MDMVWHLIGEMHPLNLIGVGVIVFFFYRRLDNKISRLSERLDKRTDSLQKAINAQSERTDKLHSDLQDSIHAHQAAMQAQSERADKLYGMFIDLLREQRKA